MDYPLTAPEPTAADERTRELAKGVANNPFLGCTREGKPGHKPRPTADDPVYRLYADDRLTVAQKQWDAAEAWAAENDRLREQRLAKQQAERDARQRERDEADATRRAEARSDLEERLRRQFMQTPGATVADWELAKDQMIADHLKAAALANDEAARRAASAWYRDL
jgi:hypothetical protein